MKNFMVSLLLILLFTLTFNFVYAQPAGVRINEIRIDQTGFNNDEYFELKERAGTSLTGLTYIVIGDGTGSSGMIEGTVNLDGQTIPSRGYFITAEETFAIGTADLTTTLNCENSDNVTHILVYQFTGKFG